MSLKLRIVSPEKIVFVGDVDSVTVPGTTGEFQVLPNHAPLISSLDEGDISYVSQGTASKVHISSGFVEINDNNVTACVEL